MLNFSLLKPPLPSPSKPLCTTIPLPLRHPSRFVTFLPPQILLILHHNRAPTSSPLLLRLLPSCFVSPLLLRLLPSCIVSSPPASSPPPLSNPSHSPHLLLARPAQTTSHPPLAFPFSFPLPLDRRPAYHLPCCIFTAKCRRQVCCCIGQLCFPNTLKPARRPVWLWIQTWWDLTLRRVKSSKFPPPPGGHTQSWPR